MQIKIRSPEFVTEFDNYYELRWRILRAPWNQPRGSEKDEFENHAYHVMATNERGILLGVARLHIVDSGDIAQIRYMAVDTPYQNMGIGSLLLSHLEEYAKTHDVTLISLNARENFLSFYVHHGFRDKGPGHTLYNSIKHRKMEKSLVEFNPKA